VDTDAHSAQALVSVMASMPRNRLDRLLADPAPGAAIWVRAAAAYGLVEAQIRLGQMLLDGTGVEQDQAKALAWFTEAARAGSAEARNMVGRCLENGWGAPSDPALAAPWYLAAAEAGDAWGQYNLGHMFLNGAGVPRDAAAALRWYRRAADQGHVRAMNLVARCHEEGWGAPRDHVAALHWYRRSAEGGYFRGQYNFATMLAAEGWIAAALPWFEAAIQAAPGPTRAVMIKGLGGHVAPALRILARRLEGGAAC
jgi:TPR repeat protein